MRLVGLISGGKDSLYNMLQCIAAGHEIVAVANIEPHKKEELDSYMYQSVGHQVVSLIAGALGLPIYRQKTKGRAVCKNRTYTATNHDEVEDLVELLNKVKKDIPIEGVSVGAISSDYQRTRVENVCTRLGLKSFAYLWRRDQGELLQEMIQAEVDAVIIKVACIGLCPDVHLGVHIRDMEDHLVDLNRKYGVNICGEGGEYETLTLDCPLFHRMITILESENVLLSNDAFAPVAFLNVKNAALRPKAWGNDDPVDSLKTRLSYIKSVIRNPYYYVQDCVDDISENIFPQHHKKSSQDLPFPFGSDETSEEQAGLSEYWKKPLPGKSVKQSSQVSFLTSTVIPTDTTNYNVNYSSGWCSLGNITGQNLIEALSFLQVHLERIKINFPDIVLVNLFVKDMAEFNSMNKVYSQFFPHILPPARVCVATALPQDTGVVLSIVAHKLLSKSQKVLLSNQASDRDTMHVQSISHWAPANIGPYSQCVKVGGLYYLAGQIPLIPGTMEILNKPILHQCRLALRHVLRVIQAMNSSLDYSNVLQAICYVTSADIALDTLALWPYITKNENATVTAVVVNDLPKNSQLEWETLACSYDNPRVDSETHTTDDYLLQMKRCVYNEPFASSLVANVSFTKKGIKNSKNLKEQSYNLILRQCLHFLRTEDKNIGTPLCTLKLFYKNSDAVMSTVISDIIRSSADFKVVVTPIPVVACEQPDIFLTITGVCH